jgi:hypothetical protein
MRISSEGDTEDTAVTTLTGIMLDQAVLASVLNNLYDLGFALLSVECLATEEGSGFPRGATA